MGAVEGRLGVVETLLHERVWSTIIGRAGRCAISQGRSGRRAMIRLAAAVSRKSA